MLALAADVQDVVSNVALLFLKGAVPTRTRVHFQVAMIEYRDRDKESKEGVEC
jgi:hypothetical protein